MAKDLKVGERVKVYYTVIASARQRKGTVVYAGSVIIKVKDDSGSILYAHSKQCRRLKPKVKKVPREVWLKKTLTFSTSTTSSSGVGTVTDKWAECSQIEKDAVLFREVIK